MGSGASAGTESPQLLLPPESSLGVSCPKHGIRVRFLDEFIDKCGGTDALQGLTTREVYQKHVIPGTAHCQQSVCALLEASDHPDVGPAEVFISHAWDAQFMDLAAVLKHHFRDRPDAVLWVDLFSINQHQSDDLSADWFTNEFQCTIDAIHDTVVVLAARDHLLTRAWCLWEMHCTLDNKCKLDLILPPNEMSAYLIELVEHTGAVLQRYKAVNVEKSACSKETDSAVLHTVMQEVGYGTMNTQIYSKLRDWSIGLLKKQMPSSSDEQRVRLSLALAHCHMDEGNSDLAEPLLIAALSSSRTLHGDSDPITLTVMTVLAELCEKDSRLEDALTLYTTVIKAQRQAHGEYHADTIQTLQCIARMHQLLCDYDQAKECFLTALKQARITLGDHHPLTLSLIQKLAVFYAETMGNYEAAINLYQEVLEDNKNRAQNKIEGVDLITLMLLLGVVHQSTGQYVQAVELYKSCLLRAADLDADHPLTMTLLNHLGDAYYSQDAWPEAIGYYKDCLTRRRQAVGASHPDTLQSLYNLALVHKSANQFDAAQPLFEECLKERRVVCGNRHPDTLCVMAQLAPVYQLNGQYEQAVELYDECLESYRTLLGEDDLTTLQVASNLAGLYQRQGKLELAEPLYQECYKLYEQQLGGEHPDTLRAMYSLAVVCHEQGKLTEAEALYEDYIHKSRSEMDIDNPDIFEAMSNLGTLYLECKRYGQAEELFSELLASCGAELGDDHPITVKVVKVLADLRQ